MSFVISHPDVEGEPAVIPERALPAYAAKGWLLEGRIEGATAPVAPALQLEQPAKGASVAEWKTYAVASGMSYDDVMAMTRDELVEHYNPTPAPKTATAVKPPKES